MCLGRKLWVGSGGSEQAQGNFSLVKELIPEENQEVRIASAEASDEMVLESSGSVEEYLPFASVKKSARNLLGAVHEARGGPAGGHERQRPVYSDVIAATSCI